MEFIKAMKIRKGKIYNLFPVDIDEHGDVEMPDCFINNYFFWLFLIMNEVDAWACFCLGIPHQFIVEYDKED